MEVQSCAHEFNVFNFRYPKDSEKQLLAVKSGLTRSQVHTYLPFKWF